MDAALSPSPGEIRLGELRITPQQITITAAAKRPLARCPACGAVSRHVHSRYVRHLADLPWHGIPVEIELQSRRFFCSTAGCSRRIFTKRPPQTAPSYARCTLRLSAAHRRIAHALGGRAGAELATALGLAASGDTLLRRLTARPKERAPVTTPRCLGIDEWAWRKGRKHYGTLLCDLEHGCVVDLLPERSSESLAAWLVAHPGVEVVSRDRSTLYAEGTRQGAPDAVQAPTASTSCAT